MLILKSFDIHLGFGWRFGLILLIDNLIEDGMVVNYEIIGKVVFPEDFAEGIWDSGIKLMKWYDLKSFKIVWKFLLILVLN